MNIVKIVTLVVGFLLLAGLIVGLVSNKVAPEDRGGLRG